jgi:PPOX class probable F420-dependent enzyme
MEAKNLAELYGLPTASWETVTSQLEGGITQAPGTGGPDRHTCWLATIDPDGAPHVTGIGAQWLDGTFWFETGLSSRKARNLARDPRCTLSVALHDADVVLEGTATVVRDPSDVERLAEEFVAGGWPCRVDDSGQALTADFSAPSAGPPPWHLFRMDIRRATALVTVEPGGATRWTF